MIRSKLFCTVCYTFLLICHPLYALNVAIIDTGVDIYTYTNVKSLPGYVPLTGRDYSLIDSHGHGSHIMGLVQKNSCNTVNYYSCNYLLDGNSDKSIANCVKHSKDMDVIVMALSGDGYSNLEYNALKAFKGFVLVAAGNAGRDISKTPAYPASYDLNRIKVVGNGLSQKNRAKSSNYGLKGMIWRDGQSVESKTSNGLVRMSGSSQALAIYAAELIDELCN